LRKISSGEKGEYPNDLLSKTHMPMQILYVQTPQQPGALAVPLHISTRKNAKNTAAVPSLPIIYIPK
jgi:hypothetical protein